jgi:hypothetical protein
LLLNRPLKASGTGWKTAGMMSASYPANKPEVGWRNRQGATHLMVVAVALRAPRRRAQRQAKEVITADVTP